MISKKNKDILVKAMRKHHRENNIKKGRWSNCHIGCCGMAFGLTDNGPQWLELSEVTNLPEWFFRLCEKIFERLPDEKSNDFSLAVCEVLPVETDITPVLTTVNIARLEGLLKLHSCSSDDKNKHDIMDLLYQCIALWQRPCTTEKEWLEVVYAAKDFKISNYSKRLFIYIAKSVKASARSAIFDGYFDIHKDAGCYAARSAEYAGYAANVDHKANISNTEGAWFEQEAKVLIEALKQL